MIRPINSCFFFNSAGNSAGRHRWWCNFKTRSRRNSHHCRNRPQEIYRGVLKFDKINYFIRIFSANVRKYLWLNVIFWQKVKSLPPIWTKQSVHGSLGAFTSGTKIAVSVEAMVKKKKNNLKCIYQCRVWSNIDNYMFWFYLILSNKF